MELDQTAVDLPISFQKSESTHLLVSLTSVASIVFHFLKFFDPEISYHVVFKQYFLYSFSCHENKIGGLFLCHDGEKSCG